MTIHFTPSLSAAYRGIDFQVHCVISTEQRLPLWWLRLEPQSQLLSAVMFSQNKLLVLCDAWLEILLICWWRKSINEHPIDLLMCQSEWAALSRDKIRSSVWNVLDNINWNSVCSIIISLSVKTSFIEITFCTWYRRNIQHVTQIKTSQSWCQTLCMCLNSVSRRRLCERGKEDISQSSFQLLSYLLQPHTLKHQQQIHCQRGRVSYRAMERWRGRVREDRVREHFLFIARVPGEEEDCCWKALCVYDWLLQQLPLKPDQDQNWQ